MPDAAAEQHALSTADPAQAEAVLASASEHPTSPVTTPDALADTADDAAELDAAVSAATEADASITPAPQADTAATAPSEGAAVLATAPAEAPAHLAPAECAARLAALFPALFGRPQPMPLKLRIQADVQQRAPGVFTKRSLSGFLQRYTTGTAYLKALVAGQERFDLDGQPAGVVADEHRDAAVAELARRRALHDERRAAERQAQRQAQEEGRRAWLADQQARQGRLALLRAFETTTLTRANFCALKQVPEAELDALLAQARVDRQQEPPPATAQRPPQGAGERAGERVGERRPDAERRPEHDRRPPGERRGPPRRAGPRPPTSR